jgi:hypothetical protein
MTDPYPTDPSPEMRRAANRLGLTLGAVALVILVGCIILFTYIGLPKDPTEARRIEMREAARAAGSDAIPQGPAR